MSVCSSWVLCMQWLVYVPVLVAGVPLNMAAVWTLSRLRRWRESTVYLLNLIINDSLLLLSLPFKIYAYDRAWQLGRHFCSLLESFAYVNIYGSVLLSVCIAADRYVALRFPFRRLRSPLKAAVICSLIWLIVLSCSYPVYSLHHHNATFCFQNFSNGTWSRRWIVVSMETVFSGSAVVMAFCSVQVVRILRRLRRRNPNDPKLRNNKSLKIVLSNLLVFLICFIPYHVAALLYFLYKSGGRSQGAESQSGHPLRDFVHSSLCMSSLNCLADGACYYFILKENLHTAKLERRATIHNTHTNDILTHTLTSHTHTNDILTHTSHTIHSQDGA